MDEWLKIPNPPPGKYMINELREGEIKRLCLMVATETYKEILVTIRSGNVPTELFEAMERGGWV